LSFLADKCTLRLYDEIVLKECIPFDCGHKDLNDFFANDAILYNAELLGKTYCFTLDANPSIIVCAFTVSNDSIKTTNLPNARKKRVLREIPHEKQMRSYPAVLIGRLGVNTNFRYVAGEELRTGVQLMDFIKSWFIDSTNKTGCRFVVVDAYNEFIPLRYYEKNGFVYLFSSEDQEKEFTGLPETADLKTRLMYFDLILLQP
jgi:hypothetical protein